MTYHLIPRIFCVGLCLLFFLAGSSLYAQTPTERIAQFQAATDAQVSVQEATQVANFVRLPQERAFRLAGGSVAEKATRFLQDYGKMFGIENPVTQLRPQSNIEDRQGFQRYVLEQHYHNVPIFDGKLQFHFNANKDIAAINGTFLPDINLNPIPTLSVATAEAIALETVTTQQRGVLNAPLSIQKNDLYIFNAGLPQGFRSTDHLVYRIEVSNALDVREFVFVDAHKGDIVAQYTGIANALYRRLYQNNTGNQIWQEGDPFPAALTNAQQNQVVVAGHTYHFFNNAFGRDSYDGNGAEMRSIDSFNGFVCSSSANATWNGETANFCPSLATDDIVGHEWAHAYTEYTNGLIYAHEAGAINEAYSDIWGETIDLLNNYEDAGEDNSIRTGKNSSTDCAESNRWKIGEDQTAFGTGAIRDMWIPSCNFDPDFVGSTDFDCDKDLSDNGGVHSNSGIPNHVYALLVDGGTYNGQTINALGFVKTAHIFWRTQTVYLTNTSDFGVLADALEQACQDLVDINLEGLSVSPTPAGLSGEIITAADGAEVAKAILAVNMRGDNACNYNTLLQPTTPICGGAGVAGETIFSENWEAGSSNWIVSQVPSDASTWDARDWTLTSNLPDGRTGTAMFGVDPSFGDCANTDRDNGIIRLQSPVINIGASVTPPFLMTFDHYIS
ncbi:MAG: M4 family metallopeptidase [Bacteroidota bacterium]